MQDSEQAKAQVLDLVQAMVREPDSARDLEQVQDSAPEQEKERAPGLEQVQALVPEQG